jgi:hypothetical protein
LRNQNTFELGKAPRGLEPKRVQVPLTKLTNERPKLAFFKRAVNMQESIRNLLVIKKGEDGKLWRLLRVIPAKAVANISYVVYVDSLVPVYIACWVPFWAAGVAAEGSGYHGYVDYVHF